jgi:hypothetical protein
LDTHHGITHFAFDLGFWYQSGDRVDHNDIDSIGTDKSFDYFESLLAVVRL